MEGFEKVRPSWEKVSAKKIKHTRKENPRIVFSSTLDEDNISNDRIGFSKDALKVLGINKTTKCEILINKKSKKLAISILDDCDTEDSFTISVSKDNASIRRKNMFKLFNITSDLIKMLQDGTSHSELKKEGSFFVAYLPVCKLDIDKKEPEHYGITIASEILQSGKKSARGRTTDMPHDEDLRKVLEDI